MIARIDSVALQLFDRADALCAAANARRMRCARITLVLRLGCLRVVLILLRFDILIVRLKLQRGCDAQR